MWKAAPLEVLVRGFVQDKTLYPFLGAAPASPEAKQVRTEGLQ